MTATQIKVLVLCTGNSARSILGEALFNHLGQGRVRAYSAGSRPSGLVNPLALETLAKHSVPLPAEVRSKSWDEFAAEGTAPMDLVITVCDAAAAESCPVVFGDFLRAHWGLPDPAGVEGDEAAREAFRQAHRVVKARLMALLALPADVWEDRAVLKEALDHIGFVEP